MKKSFKETLAAGKADRAPKEDVRAEAESIISRYSGMNETELMTELKKATAKQKAEGRFDPSAVKQGVESILPMLNDQQKRKLFEILGQI